MKFRRLVEDAYPEGVKQHEEMTVVTQYVRGLSDRLCDRVLEENNGQVPNSLPLARALAERLARVSETKKNLCWKQELKKSGGKVYLAEVGEANLVECAMSDIQKE